MRHFHPSVTFCSAGSVGHSLPCQVSPPCPYSLCPFPAEAWQSYFNTSEGQLPPKTAGKPSAHLTLRPQSLAQDGELGNPSGHCWGSKWEQGRDQRAGARAGWAADGERWLLFSPS